MSPPHRVMEFRLPEVDQDIRAASTLPGSFYCDARWFHLCRERVFAPSWQFVGDTDRVTAAGQFHPFTLLEGCVDEPLLLTRDADDRLHCLSNVCTHRGNLLAERDGTAQILRCRYHGRRFGLDGRFLSMPEFEGVVGFPSEADSLSRASLGQFGKLLFAAVNPLVAFDDWIHPVRERLAWFPMDCLAFEPSGGREYVVQANWALYCDNYVEGFHIPYVHGSLAAALDYGAYRTELFEWGTLQLGIAATDESAAFELPATSRDHGHRVAAYYFWLFPNTMLNFYPWGLSVNIVRPLAPDRTKVAFLSYVLDPAKRERGAGAGLERVEREDEEIVENVQRGIRARLYRRGRYSVNRETGVHHFHRLLARILSDGCSSRS